MYNPSAPQSSGGDVSPGSARCRHPPPSQGRVPGSPLQSLPATLVPDPPAGGDTASRGLLLRRFKGEQLVAARSIAGWAARHSPPRWQPERALHQAAPAANNYVLSKSMGYNWTIKISLSSWLRVPQPAACWGRPQPAATETASRPRQPWWVMGTGCTEVVQPEGTRMVATTSMQHRRRLSQ